MGMPVKLSDDLVEQARAEAKAADRSITAQIEHWAKLGRSVETALRHDELHLLKHGAEDLRSAFPNATKRATIVALLLQVAKADRTELANELKRDRTVYQNDPDGSDALERIEPDGTRSKGHLVGWRFVAERTRRASRR